jgi:hypothetical protein
LLEAISMKWILSVLIACSLLLPFSTALADQTTAPGQQKKESGDGSAKEYAPGQDKNSEAEEKAKPEKGKASAPEKAPSAPTRKAKAKK